MSKAGICKGNTKKGIKRVKTYRDPCLKMGFPPKIKGEKKANEYISIKNKY